MNMMGTGVWRHIGCGLLWALALSGCETLYVSPQPAAPFFTSTATDTARLEAVTRELDRMAPHCVDPAACERIHYTRALGALFENREAARILFLGVLNANPSSPLAASSALWLQLLEQGGVSWMWTDYQQSPLTEVTAQFVREWIDRNFANLRDGVKMVVTENRPDAAAGESGLVQSLQRQVRERERRIAELTSQLNTLKLIDHDVDEWRPSNRLPVTLTHPETDRGR